MPSTRIKLLKTLIREYLGDYTVARGQPMGSPPNLQGKDNAIIRGSNRSLQDDVDDDAQREKQDNDALPQCVCCLIIAKDGTLLSVSRKDNPLGYGMPGGHVEPGEDLEVTASRELAEETGLVAKKLKKVFSKVDSSGNNVTTFLCTAEGEIDTNESGVIRWVTPKAMLSGPFAEYNKELFKAVNIDV